MRLRTLSTLLLTSACLSSCAHHRSVAEKPPRIDTPEILPRPTGPIAEMRDGAWLVPADVAEKMVARMVHYEDMPRIIGELLDIQQRQDEGHWRAWHDQEVAFMDPPMPMWELLCWIGGSLLVGGAIGATIVVTSVTSVTAAR